MSRKVLIVPRSPRGETPIIKSWDRRDRLSAISALTIPPPRRRLGLHFEVLDLEKEKAAVFVALAALSVEFQYPRDAAVGASRRKTTGVPESDRLLWRFRRDLEATAV